MQEALTLDDIAGQAVPRLEEPASLLVEVHGLLHNNFLLNDMQPSSNAAKTQCHGARKQLNNQQQAAFQQRLLKDPPHVNFFDL